MRASRQYDQDILIAEYTLGLLTPQETAHVHTLMASDSAAAVTALKWESSFLKLVDALEPVTPPAHVLKQIQTSLGHSPSPPAGRLLRPAAPQISRAAHSEPVIDGISEKTPAEPAGSGQAEPRVSPSNSSSIPSESATVSALADRRHDAARASTTDSNIAVKPRRGVGGGISALWNSPGMWRILVAALAVACAALALKPSPPLIHITETAPTHAAILSAPGTSSTPGWVLTIDTANNVLLTPQVSTEIGAQNTVQLWTQNAQDDSPRSLGLIDVNRPVIIKAADIGLVQPSQLFEMTLEAQGGSATGQPTGPVLFIGRVVLFGSPEPTVHDATNVGAAS